MLICATSRDHPRVGGEKELLVNVSKIDQGSPPRGRGKAALHVVLFQVHGITPAWAGKSHKCNFIKKILRDHPRVGGEKITSPICRESLPGSPPRGRGKDGCIMAL